MLIFVKYRWNIWLFYPLNNYPHSKLKDRLQELHRQRIPNVCTNILFSKWQILVCEKTTLILAKISLILTYAQFYFIENIFAMLGGCIFQQTFVFPMGIYSVSLLCRLGPRFLWNIPQCSGYSIKERKIYAGVLFQCSSM